MPYESDKQRRFMHARHPEIAKRWDKMPQDDAASNEPDWRPRHRHAYKASTAPGPERCTECYRPPGGPYHFSERKSEAGRRLQERRQTGSKIHPLLDRRHGRSKNRRMVADRRGFYKSDPQE